MPNTMTPMHLQRAPTDYAALAAAVVRLTAEVDRLSQRLDAADVIIDELVRMRP
jgi:hypothetical protein